MLGMTGYLPTLNSARAILIASAAIAVLSIFTPAAAHASGCTDSWTNTAGGSWFTGGNWSKNAPPSSEEEACITAPGTYTVTMFGTSAVSVHSLTIGAASGTQTLSIGSTCSVNAALTTTAGIVNGAQGAIELTNGDGCANNVTVTGPITNAGALLSEPAHGGSRRLEGSITNTGAWRSTQTPPTAARPSR